MSVQPKSEWDVCGATALVQARGGSVLRLDERPLVFNQARTRIPCGFVAGPAAAAADLLRRIQDRSKKIGAGR